MTSRSICLILLASGCRVYESKQREKPVYDDTGTTTTNTNTNIVGCVTVDGKGAYDGIANAMVAASDGSIIDLTPCNGKMVEHATINKAVTILATDTVTYQADDPVGLAVTVPGVSIEGLQVEVQGLGISWTDGIVLTGVAVSNASGTGLYGADGTSTLTNVTVSGALRGIVLEGGNAAITDASISDSGDAAVFLDQTTTEILRLTVDNADFGVVAAEAALSLRETTLTGIKSQGVLAAGPQPLTVDGLTITDDGSVDVAAKSWAKGGYLGTGLAVRGDTMVLTDLTVTGFNNAGVVALRDPKAKNGSLVLDGVTIDGVGRLGILARELTVTADGVTVENLAEREVETDPCETFQPGSAIQVVDATSSWDNTVLNNNAGYGLVIDGGSATVDGAVAQSNRCASIMNNEGSLVVTAGDFSGAGVSGFAASIAASQAISTTITGSSFHEAGTNTVVSAVEYEDKGITILEELSHDVAVDIYDSGSTALSVSNTTFRDGATGIVSEGTPVVVQNSTWSGYGDVLVEVVDAAVTLEDPVVTGSAGPVLHCEGTEAATIARLTAEKGGSRTATLDIYQDGKLASSTLVVDGMAAIRSNGCVLNVSDTTLTDLGGGGIDADGSVTLTDLTITNTGADAPGSHAVGIVLDKGSATLTRVSTTNHEGGNGINLSGNAKATATLDSVTVEGALAQGIAISGIEAALTDATSTLNGGNGFWFSRGTVDITGGVGDQNTLMGLWMSDSTATISGSTFDANGASGVYGTDSSLFITTSSISSNGFNGVTLLTVTGSVEDNTISQNADYGMSCSDSSPDPCGNTMADNVSGDLLGCPAACVY